MSAHHALVFLPEAMFGKADQKKVCSEFRVPYSHHHENYGNGLDIIENDYYRKWWRPAFFFNHNDENVPLDQEARFKARINFQRMIHARAMNNKFTVVFVSENSKAHEFFKGVEFDYYGRYIDSFKIDCESGSILPFTHMLRNS